MFTTIQKLRDSSALQDRVAKVEKYLKKTYDANWAVTRVFPIAIIAVCNSLEDYEWVLDMESTHVTDPKQGISAAVRDMLQKKFDEYPNSKGTLARARLFLELINIEIPTLLVPLSITAAPSISTAPSPTTEVDSAPAHVDRVADAKIANGASTKVSFTPDLLQGILSKIRTRAVLEAALRDFTYNKLVVNVSQIPNAVVKAEGIEVPKGKQAYVVVF